MVAAPEVISTPPVSAPGVDGKVAGETTVVPNGITPHENGGQSHLLRFATWYNGSGLRWLEDGGTLGGRIQGDAVFFGLGVRVGIQLQSTLRAAQMHYVNSQRDMEKRWGGRSGAGKLEGATGESRTELKSRREGRLAMRSPDGIGGIALHRMGDSGELLATRQRMHPFFSRNKPLNLASRPLRINETDSALCA